MPNNEFPKYGMSVDPNQDRNANDGGCWKIYDSDFDSYLADFARVDYDRILPGIIRSLIETPEPVIVDAMASTTALHSIVALRGGRPINGVAIGVGDNRDTTQRQKDKRAGISRIAINLRDPKRIEAIMRRTKPNKVQLFMTRGQGGLDFVQTNKEYYDQVGSSIWDCIMPGGFALLQIPPEESLSDREIPIREWLRRTDRLGISTWYLPSYESIDEGRRFGLLMAQRKADIGLPNLSALPFSYRKSLSQRARDDVSRKSAPSCEF